MKNIAIIIAAVQRNNVVVYVAIIRSQSPCQQHLCREDSFKFTL